MKRNPIYLAELHAQLLDLQRSIGKPVFASHRTVAALHGFDGYELDPPFHVVVPRHRNVRRIGHIVHTATALERLDQVIVQGVAATSPARTLIDLAAVLDTEQ